MNFVTLTKLLSRSGFMFYKTCKEQTIWNRRDLPLDDFFTLVVHKDLELVASHDEVCHIKNFTYDEAPALIAELSKPVNEVDLRPHL